MATPVATMSIINKSHLFGRVCPRGAHSCQELAGAMEAYMRGTFMRPRGPDAKVLPPQQRLLCQLAVRMMMTITMMMIGSQIMSGPRRPRR